MVGLRLPVLAGVGVVALLSAGVPAAAQEDAFEYVAMGDSAAAGPLVPGPDPNLLCFRSTSNYPQVAAARLGAQLKDVTCSGAETEDFSGRQHHVLPPQYDALSETTDLVTVTIGGNDISLVQAAVSCLNAFPEPVGSSCADDFTANGDELAERIDEFTPDFDEALEEITDRAPNARVVVVGYGTYLPPGGCYPKQPMWARDADYIQSTVDRLSARLDERARAHGAMFVDLGPVSEGHDVCQASQDKYFEGVVPTSWAAPLHPNANGMTAFGNAVADAVSEASPNRVRAAQVN
ncbi:SGNH/GDSL hydrolase family protein [Saccharopolyspora terrae]|nr:SGNH/GDSL hydrolase family protein [Saccharopolyspora terrae]